MRNSHSQITIALEHIITKCGETLYESYLQEKLPNDCNERVVGNIQASLDVMVVRQPVKNRIRREIMPRPASVDTIMPMKVRKVRVRDWDGSETKKSVQPKLFNTQLPTSSEKALNREHAKSAKPNFCIKYSCAKGEIDLNQQRVRRQKMISDREQLKSATETNRSDYNVRAKRKNLQAKIKQLVVEGVPYAFDDDGNLIAPDIKTYKKDMQIQNKKAQAKPFTLRFKALQVLSGESEIMSHSKLLGRKKGYTSINSERKKKINDEQFNNKNQRQCSTIPFMDIQSGIKIVERQRNIMAEKLRQPQTNRQQFQTESKKSLFKSYLPLSEYEGVSRPATHSHNRHSRSVGLSSGISLNSRPKTSRETNRVNINNKQLAIQLFKDDEALNRRFT